MQICHGAHLGLAWMGCVPDIDYKMFSICLQNVFTYRDGSFALTFFIFVQLLFSYKIDLNLVQDLHGWVSSMRSYE